MLVCLLTTPIATHSKRHMSRTKRSVTRCHGAAHSYSTCKVLLCDQSVNERCRTIWTSALQAISRLMYNESL